MVKSNSKVTRRKFIRGGAVAVGSGAAILAAPNLALAAPRVLKVQAAWGGGIFLENAKSYVDRVHAMAGKDLKIDLLSVNSVVKTSQMQDAVHRGVLDVAHYVTAYWYSKSKSAGYRFPPEIIRQAIWLYLRLTISLRGDEKARCRGSKAGDQPKGFSLFTRPSITPSMSNAS